MHRASEITLYSERHHVDHAAGKAAARAVRDGTADLGTLLRVGRLAGALRGGARPSVAAAVAGVSAGYAEGVLSVVRRG